VANTKFGKGAYSIGVILLLLVVCGFSLAQTRKKQVEKPVQRNKEAVSVPAKRTPSPSPSPMAPVALVSASQPEYMSGEANVTVKGNQNPIIRLGLAQNGVNVIEFPAADSFFMIHPGNSDLVSFDEETAKRSKRSLVLRPGAAFVAPPDGSTGKGPSASITVQMQSGVVVTFLIYPVRELSQNAHRCVVMYNREEVVAARKMAGLAVNLDGREPSPKRSNGSVRFADDGEDDAGQEIVVPKLSRLIADVDSTRADERARTGKVSSKRPKLSEAAAKALRDVIKNPNKMGAFGKPNHGLSMALMPVIDLDMQSRMVVIAVRNDGGGVLRIVEGNPEVYVQTFDNKGKTLQLEQVKRLYVESTSLDGKLNKGEVVYYAIVYEAPVLGVLQRLRVSVSQTEAADEPATAGVGTKTSPRNK
jgi:hypothetical protein